jgi:hypothetical protein
VDIAGPHVVGGVDEEIHKPDDRAFIGIARRLLIHLGKIAAADPSIRFHYVTAREMVNILHAAEDGHSGEPGIFRDHCYRKSGAADSA